MTEVPSLRDDDLAELASMDDDEFAEALKDSLRDPEDWPLFLDGSLVARSYTALRKLQVAEAEKVADIKVIVNRKTGAARRGLQERLARSKARQRVLGVRIQAAAVVIHEMKPSDGDRIRLHAERMEFNATAARVAVRKLAWAIHRHRLAAVEADVTPEPSDRELWSSLDEVKVPRYNGLATLTEMLESGVWDDRDE